MTTRRSDYFSNLLLALWLRPESALWYSHMLSAAAQFGADRLPTPSLEFGCMDGLNAHVLLGGAVTPDFDVFQEVKWSQESHKRTTLSDDYFDTLNEDFRGVDLGITKERPFDYGVDWKLSHIEKAKRLRAHNQFVMLKDGTLGNLTDDSIGGIWAPNIYWMEEMPEILREFRRVLKRGGRVITICPDERLLKNMLFRFADIADAKWLASLDRGRYENASRHSRSSDGWRCLFSDAGLRVVRHEMFIPAIVGQIYEVGLRPLFPILMNMYERLSKGRPEDLVSLKRSWVDRLHVLLDPFVEDGTTENFGPDKLWHIFELTPEK